MSVNDADKLLVNDGSATETITFAQLKDGNVLNDTDKFLVNDGTKTETVSWNEIKEEIGVTSPPELVDVVLAQDGDVDANRFTSKEYTATVTAEGGAPTALEMTAKVEGALDLKLAQALLRQTIIPAPVALRWCWIWIVTPTWAPTLLLVTW